FDRAFQGKGSHTLQTCHRTETLRASLHLHGKLKAIDSFRKTGIIIDLVGGPHLPARSYFLQYKHRESRPSTIKRCCISARTAAHDDNVPNLMFHAEFRLSASHWDLVVSV